MKAAEENRLRTAPAEAVRSDIEEHLAFLEQRLEETERQIEKTVEHSSLWQIVTKPRNQRMQILLPTSDLRIIGARLLVLFGLSMTLLVGCELPFGIGSDDGDGARRLQIRDQVEIEPGLVARLYAPEQVATGDSFQVRFATENAATVPIQLETGACWGQPAAFVDGEQVPVVGSFQACTMQLVSRTLPGNDTRERTFDLKALQNASNGSPEVEGPAEPGTYTLRTTLEWRVNGREVTKRLEADVEIVGQA